MGEGSPSPAPRGIARTGGAYVTPTHNELVQELRAALEAEKGPRAALTSARQRYNSARRDLRAAERDARAAEQRLNAAIRALDLAGVDPASVLIPPSK